MPWFSGLHFRLGGALEQGVLVGDSTRPSLGVEGTRTGFVGADLVGLPGAYFLLTWRSIVVPRTCSFLCDGHQAQHSIL